MPDTFRCGHERVPENIAMTGSPGRKYAACLICRRERDKQRKASPEYKARNAELKRIQEYKKTGREVPVTKRTRAAANAATEHLKLPVPAIQAEHELHLAYDTARGNCDEKPAAWIDYPEDEPPQRSVARVMCADCPLFNECGEFAKATKPYMGVWAGQIYQDGKVI